MADDKCAVIADQEATIKRLHDLILDACKVFDHYDLPEHAFHYRRQLLGLEPAKTIVRANAGLTPSPIHEGGK